MYDERKCTVSVLIIDSRDSFTYNIAALLHKSGVCSIDIQDSKKFTVADEWIELLNKQAYTHLIIGPGPGSPIEYPPIIDLIPRITQIKIPILGICLGHQMIAHAYGGNVRPTGIPAHGKKSCFYHKHSSPLFKNIPSPYTIGRYHSLAVEFLPSFLTASGHIKDNKNPKKRIIMSFENRQHKIYGIQFHPESFLSQFGTQLIRNFITIK